MAATKRATTRGKATRSRGRPRSSLPDRDWAAEECTKLERLAALYVERGEKIHAVEVRAKLAAFKAALPKRYRAGKLALEYEERSNLGALDGPAGARRDDAIRSAVAAVSTYLRARQVIKASKSDAHAAHLPRLAAMAEAACGAARATALGVSRISRGRFTRGLAHLDGMLERGEWPDELSESRKSRAIIVVTHATDLYVGTVRDIARRR